MQRISRGFTIIELLVVVSIIALLVGILLPAIGKAREQAQMTQSQGNLKNIGAAAQTYAAEYADRQLTYCVDNISTYGVSNAAFQGYSAANGIGHPNVVFGVDPVAGGQYWGFIFYPDASPGNAIACCVPIDFSTGGRFGSFRILQGRSLSTYLGGKFYGSIYYAPKDTAVVSTVQNVVEHPNEYSSAGLAWPGTPNPPGNVPRWGSYCFSPAGMLNPDVLSRNASGDYYTDPWTLAAGYKSPAMSQATYPDLKTHIIEHHWLQNRRKVCSPDFGTSGPYNGCQPYFYNGSRESAPVTVYYDGHIGNRGQRDAIESNQRVFTQSGQTGSSEPQHGLWSIDTTWSGSYTPNTDGGYYHEASIDTTGTSYHMLTIDGIKGRDFLSK